MPGNLSNLEIAGLTEEEIEQIKNLEDKLNRNKNNETAETVYLIAVKNKPSAGLIHI